MIDGTLYLTQREQQVMGLTTQGLSSKEIAKKLNIDFSTVEQYLFRVRRKLNAKNKAHAVYLVLSQHLIDLDVVLAS